MKQKMKYAARMGVAYAAIIGTDEAVAGTLALKDMNGEGGQKTVTAKEAIEILKN
jgi:histidyl-tRNA synthetase